MKSSLWNGIALAAGLVLLAVGVPWLARELRSLPSAGTLAGRAGTRIATLDVGGLTCDGCATAVERHLAAIPGVETASVRIPQKRADVVCAKDVHDTTLVRAVTAAGPGFVARVVSR